MKRLLMLVAVVAAATWACGGSAPEGPRKLRFALIPKALDIPVFDYANAGAQRQAAELGNIEVIYRGPDHSDELLQKQVLESFIQQKVDGIAISVLNAESMTSTIDQAVDAGIPVISMNSGSDVYKDLGVRAHVGQTELEAGIGGGQRMKAAGVTNALCVNQEVGNVALDLRCQGFTQGLGEGTKVQVLSVSIDPTGTNSAVKAALQQDPSINGILTLGPVAWPSFFVMSQASLSCDSEVPKERIAFSVPAID